MRVCRPKQSGTDHRLTGPVRIRARSRHDRFEVRTATLRPASSSLRHVNVFINFFNVSVFRKERADKSPEFLLSMNGQIYAVQNGKVNMLKGIFTTFFHF